MVKITDLEQFLKDTFRSKDWTAKKSPAEFMSIIRKGTLKDAENCHFSMFSVHFRPDGKSLIRAFVRSFPSSSGLLIDLCKVFMRSTSYYNGSKWGGCCGDLDDIWDHLKGAAYPIGLKDSIQRTIAAVMHGAHLHPNTLDHLSEFGTRPRHPGVWIVGRYEHPDRDTMCLMLFYNPNMKSRFDNENMVLISVNPNQLKIKCHLNTIKTGQEVHDIVNSLYPPATELVL